MIRAIFVRNDIFFHLTLTEIDLLTLKMTLKKLVKYFQKLISQSNSQENEILHLFLASLVEQSFLTLKFIFDLKK